MCFVLSGTATAAFAAGAADELGEADQRVTTLAFARAMGAVGNALTTATMLKVCEREGVAGAVVTHAEQRIQEAVSHETIRDNLKVEGIALADAALAQAVERVRFMMAGYIAGFQHAFRITHELASVAGAEWVTTLCDSGMTRPIGTNGTYRHRGPCRRPPAPAGGSPGPERPGNGG